MSSNRYEYWRVGLGRSPTSRSPGVGAGGFRVVWLQERPIPRRCATCTRCRSSWPAELGLPGLLGLALLVGGVRSPPGGRCAATPPRRPAPAPRWPTWPLHASIDWDWQLPAVTLPALVLAGGLVALGESARAGRAAAARSSRPPREPPDRARARTRAAAPTPRGCRARAARRPRAPPTPRRAGRGAGQEREAHVGRRVGVEQPRGARSSSAVPPRRSAAATPRAPGAARRAPSRQPRQHQHGDRPHRDAGRHQSSSAIRGASRLEDPHREHADQHEERGRDSSPGAARRRGRPGASGSITHLRASSNSGASGFSRARPAALRHELDRVQHRGRVEERGRRATSR